MTVSRLSMCEEMETLKQFEERTNSFIYNSIPTEGMFYTSEGLKKKVTGVEEVNMSVHLSKEHVGLLKAYGGNTVVFTLDEETKEYCEKIQNLLLDECSEVLAEKLDRETFHVTLHDLVNGSDPGEIKAQMDMAKKKAQECLKHIEEMGLGLRSHIHMETTCVFNMASTSIVLGLKPADEESCNLLMMLYKIFQNVIELPYPLTPHITLMYFKPNQYRADELEGLRNVIKQVNHLPKLKVELDVNQLCYMEFSDMNHYYRRK